MKTQDGLTYLHLALIAVASELVLIAVQYVYLKDFVKGSGSEFAFTSDFMKSRGFYVFQVIGFFLDTVIAYLATARISNKVFNKLATFVVAGGAVEITFYLLMRAEYEGAFLYSVLDKIVAVVFGLILFVYTTDKDKRPKSYL